MAEDEEPVTWDMILEIFAENVEKVTVDDVLEVVALSDRAGDAIETFSGGMKRRLNFGCGIVHEPPVMLLDEPTVGVDPQSRERLFELVEAERDRGTCVLYTTHYMEEAERLCDSLAIIDHGMLIAQGALSFEMWTGVWPPIDVMRAACEQALHQDDR